MSVWSLTYHQSVFKRYHSDKTFWEFLPTRWRQISTGNRYGTKLRNCHPMYNISDNDDNNRFPEIPRYWSAHRGIFVTLFSCVKSYSTSQKNRVLSSQPCHLLPASWLPCSEIHMLSSLGQHYRGLKCADTIGTVLVPWAGYFQC